MSDFENYLGELEKEAQVNQQAAALGDLSIEELAKLAGVYRPRAMLSGAGKGKGMPSGLRRFKKEEPCSTDGPGAGEGGGRGKGKTRGLPPQLAANAAKVKAVQDPNKPGAETLGSAALKKTAWQRLIAPTIATATGAAAGEGKSKKASAWSDIITKEAAKETQKVDPGWLEASRGMRRASQRSSEGIGQYINHPELIGELSTGQLAGGLLGGAGGAGLGALGGLLAKKPCLGAMVGAAAGAIIGSTAGAFSGQKKFLQRRGITPKWGVLAGAKFSPEAAKKYLAGQSSEKKASAWSNTLAKLAKITPEDIQSEVMEADPQAMRKSYGTKGALVGATVGAGVGIPLAGRLGKWGPLAAIGSGILGGVGGGLLGGHLGKAEAERSGAYRQLLSRHMAQKGYGAGAQRGFGVGTRAGAQAYHRALQQAIQRAGQQPARKRVPGTVKTSAAAGAAKQVAKSIPIGEAIKQYAGALARHPITAGGVIGGLGGAGIGAATAEPELRGRGALVGGLTGATLGALGGVLAREFGVGSATAYNQGVFEGAARGATQGVTDGHAVGFAEGIIQGAAAKTRVGKTRLGKWLKDLL